MNDLPFSLKDDNVRCDLFADDSTIHAKEKSVEAIKGVLQGSLNKIEKWCNANQIILNSE